MRIVRSGFLVVRRILFFGWHGQAKRRHAEEKHAGARPRRAWACHPTPKIRCVVALGLVLSLPAGCGSGVSTIFPHQLLAADGHAILLDDVKVIVNNTDLTDDDKRAQLRDLGLDDEKLIDALLTL